MSACVQAPTRTRAARAGLAALLGLALACYATEPVLPPHDPPPNVPAGTLLLEVPADVVASLRTQRVIDDLSTVLLAEKLKVPDEAALPAERRDQIAAHRIVTGMTVREVIWCFLAEPARERHQGPPGGRTLLWETRRAGLGRYWVRFDERGLAVDAGRW